MLDFIGKWKDKATDYIDKRVTIIKLEIVEKLSQVLSSLVLGVICIMLITPILLLLGIAAGEYAAELVDSKAAGYLIAAGLYLFLLIILFACRKSFTNSFSGMFIKAMTAVKDEEEDHLSEK